MSAYDELCRGEVGAETYAMLLDVGQRTVRAKNFPPPDGKDDWDADDTAELVHEMVVTVSKRGPFADEMLAAAGDDLKLRSVVARRVANAFADRARRTDVGHLIGNVKKVLKSSSSPFIEVEASWWSTDPDAVAGVDGTSRNALLRAVSAVPGVVLTRWSVDVDRRSPFVSRADMVRLISAALVASATAVHERELFKVLADYFGLRPDEVALDDENVLIDVADDAAPPDDVLDVTARAQLIWVQLSDDERTIVPWLEDSSGDIATGTGFGRTKAHNVRKSARTIVGRVLGANSSGSFDYVSEQDAARVLKFLQEYVVNSPDWEAHP